MLLLESYYTLLASLQVMTRNLINLVARKIHKYEHRIALAKSDVNMKRKEAHTQIFG